MEGLTFAALLTAAGAGVGASLVTGLISLLRTAFSALEKVNGAGLAFVLTAILYVLAAIDTHVSTLDAALGVFIAWLTCATAAVGVHKLIVKPIAAAVKPE